MKSPVKLLLFDLDDTLLNSEKYISQTNISAISKCKSLGMVIGYITARSPRKVKTYLKDLPCDCIAFYNGASIFAGDILIEKNVIPFADGISTLTAIQNAYPDVSISAYLEPYSFSKGQIRNIITEEAFTGALKDLPEYDFQRIRITTHNYEAVSLSQFITGEMRCFLSRHGTAMIMHKKANKENVRRKLAEYFKIAVTEVVAFGDDNNDMDMIKAAGTGVAVGNAIDDVKAAADFVCDTNDNDGVAKWINKFLI